MNAVVTERPVAVVTGAGSGLGRSLAQALSGDWALLLVGRRGERLVETGASLPAAACWHSVVADVGSPGAAQRIVEACLARFGRLDALVNNAGLARFGPIADALSDHIEEMLRTNLTGPLALIRRAAPELRRRQGVVVNIGSIGGVLALPERSAYGASKAALHHATRSLARELAPEVRVNAVLPGALDTDIYRDVGWPPDRVDQVKADMIRTTPLGRMGRPEDVVPWIQLLLGPGGGWVTGSLFVVDGGRSC